MLKLGRDAQPIYEGRVTGVVIGIVEDLRDPDNLGRIRVRLPHLADELTDWTRVAAPMAGSGRGFFFRPQKGDEVLLAPEHGQARRYYVIGALWSAADKPPPDLGEAVKNNIRAIVTPRGHRITFDDTPGSELIRIVDHSGKQTVVIDGSSITIRVGGGDLTLQATGSINLSADQDVVIKGQRVNIN
jgi:uncharacterized protein involved in type VI secretion and phage assembly